MGTGACGINCKVCGLNAAGICSPCGSGTSHQAQCKLDAQERLLGVPCPILACARLNRLEYCMRDCPQFPCENFSGDGTNGYPFSGGFLAMQKRRKKEFDVKKQTAGQLAIPEQHWQKILDRGIETVCRCTGASRPAEDFLLIDVMNTRVRVAVKGKRIDIEHEATWVPAPPLLAFVTAVYLAQSESHPLTGTWVTEKDLSCSSFFRGIHQLRTGSLLNRFGTAPRDLVDAALTLGGVETGEIGDAAVRLWVFPTVPIKLILWCGDDELDSGLTVLFDQSIDVLLAGDGIWALVELVCETLVQAAP